MERFLSVDRSSRQTWTAPLPSVVALLLERAEGCLERGDRRHAATFFEAAIGAAADRTPEPRVAYALFLADGEEEEAAEAQLLTAWNMARAAASREARALVCYNLSVLCGRRGDWIRARQFQQLALGAWLETERGAELPSWLRRLSAAQWMQGDEPEAYQLLCADDEGAESAGQWFEAVDQAGDIEGVIERLERAAQAAREGRDSFGEALVYETLGAALRYLGRGHEAAEMLLRSERLHDRAQRFRARERCRRLRAGLRSLRAFLDGDSSRN